MTVVKEQRYRNIRIYSRDHDFMSRMKGNKAEIVNMLLKFYIENRVI